ncbi:hypothetical protein M404DRAFT_154116 [Pisolithus tinctorius Marx 270]|uniref:Uncharacterized protein n=1 Tax=Pisolithus tinctorius Marx 270 TaxID=870435 RepID=A0A0C3ISK3_PISTI|nr:hypothetical protein M404DRAFT_154116 [Pisolithus tinctorius Marx 270]
MGPSANDYSLGYTTRHSDQGSPAFFNGHAPRDTRSHANLQPSSGTIPLPLLVEEIKKINTNLSELRVANIDTRRELAHRIEAAETAIAELREELSSLSSKQTKLPTVTKNISNQHPKLKTILHNKVLELCAVDRLSTEERLSIMAEHIRGLPNKHLTEEIDGRVIWRPAWSEQVDSTVNTSFLRAIVDTIMADETARRLQSKGELEDEDHVPSTIMTMAKQYWRTLAAEVRAAADPVKQVKSQDRNREKRHRARQAQMANRRREATREFEKRYDVDSVDAMLDTDFGSDHLTIDEDMSEDSHRRRKKQDVPMNGWMRVGLTWRSLDISPIIYVNCDDASGRPIDSERLQSTSEPTNKRRKTTKKRDNFTRSFDAAPSKMEDQPPHSGKAKPTIPFRTMINEAWLTAHPSQQVMDGMHWLKGFYSHAKEGELSTIDRDYLDELAKQLGGDEDI